MPDLLLGLAGIGYFLVRAYDSGANPTVLLPGARLAALGFRFRWPFRENRSYLYASSMASCRSTASSHGGSRQVDGASAPFAGTSVVIVTGTTCIFVRDP
jgi:hypothetical protein